MAASWIQRKERLTTLLKSDGDEDADGVALDRLLHGQSVIGRTSRTAEIDRLRFHNDDLKCLGTLERGQFGIIDIVNCHHDGRLYIRKSIEKRMALRTRDQCFPQFERDILLRARKSQTRWAPHLLCAFQTETHLNIIMDYAEGGNLWDALESHPEGRLCEQDLMWWAPQMVSAIQWCHSQGFAHRDIKPHNFVLTSESRLLLIDFGSAAPLLPVNPDGCTLIPKRYCLVPCGTCDYISPEVLRAHEDALVDLEMDEANASAGSDAAGYGLESDWWSLGAMLYELAFGVAPFFAQDIGQTYLNIIAHNRSIRFPASVSISSNFKDLLKRLLCDAEVRLGRFGSHQLIEHAYFVGVDWTSLSTSPAPPELHLPQFIYSEAAQGSESSGPPNSSQAFPFSAFFDQSSQEASVELPALHSTPSNRLSVSNTSSSTTSSFIGFSWGPPKDAFATPLDGQRVAPVHTPRPSRLLSVPASSHPSALRYGPQVLTATPAPLSLLTPVRQTAPRLAPGSTARRSSAARRAMSDREAMKQLVQCIGMSARKKVLESGRKPRILPSFSKSITLKKELRFVPSPVSVPDYAPNIHLTANSFVPGSASSDATESEGPPSPSPSPRPGSAMSFVSRRSATPTVTGTFSQRLASTSGSMLLNLPPRQTSGVYVDESRSDNGSTLFTDGIFDIMDSRHAVIMSDISSIESQLSQISAFEK